jgi:hypothetical protein
VKLGVAEAAKWITGYIQTDPFINPDQGPYAYLLLGTSTECTELLGELERQIISTKPWLGGPALSTPRVVITYGITSTLLTRIGLDEFRALFKENEKKKEKPRMNFIIGE